jgi:hypothetical protein
VDGHTFLLFYPTMSPALPKERPEQLNAEQRSALIEGAIAYWKAAVERLHLFDFNIVIDRCECPTAPQSNSVRVTVALDVPQRSQHGADYNSVYPLRLVYQWSAGEYRTDAHEDALTRPRNAIMRLMGLGDFKILGSKPAEHQPPLRERAATIYEKGIVWATTVSADVDIDSVPHLIRAIRKVKSWGGMRIIARPVQLPNDVAAYATVELGFTDGAARNLALNELNDPRHSALRR